MDIFEGLEKGDFGISALSLNREETPSIEVPQQIGDEVPTLNRMGYMKVDMDEFCQDFINYAEETNNRVLELGCAYGMIVQKVLERQGKIIASDLSKDHLSVLFKNAPRQYLDNLFLLPGKFPEEIILPTASVGAVLTSRMMHFLTPKSIELGLTKIHNWLLPEGKFFFTAVSPHHDVFRDKFLHIYEKRLKEGEKWPGVIENQWQINPKHEEYVGQYLNIFDIPQLERLLPEHGFTIEKIEYFDYPNDTESQSKKGHIGLVARKV
jgi:SAM-dependent methyltransferase